MSPDPAHGFVYPCYPHAGAWYATAFMVVKSWDFLAFFVVAFIGTVVRWEEPSGRRDRPQWTYNRADTLAVCIGVALGIAFVLKAEPPVIDWLMAQGIKPPALPCSPLSPNG